MRTSNLETVPVVELDKINSIGRWKVIPPPDTPGLIVPAYAPDEETKAAAEVLKILQKQQPAVGHHESWNLSTPPGEAEYFEGGRADEDCLRISEKAEDAQFTHLSATYTSHTCRFDLHKNCRYPSSSKSASRGLNESYPQRRFTQLTQSGFKVHWQEGYQ